MAYSTSIDMDTQVGRRRFRLVLFNGSTVAGSDEYSISGLPFFYRVAFCNISANESTSPQFFLSSGGDAMARTHAPRSAAAAHVFEPFDGISIPGDGRVFFRLDGATSADVNGAIVFELFDAA